MAKSYPHLTAEERYYIKERLRAGDWGSEIARSKGRLPSRVCRELKRNKGGCVGTARNSRAPRRRHAARPRGVRLTGEVKTHVIGKLREHWSPEQISGRMRRDGGAWVSHETIYRLVWEHKRGAYFARPHHSCGRGLNEHSNGLLRQYFFKSCPSAGSPTNRSFWPSAKSTTGHASASASKPASKYCNQPSTLAKSLFHPALHFKLDCRVHFVDSKFARPLCSAGFLGDCIRSFAERDLS